MNCFLCPYERNKSKILTLFINVRVMLMFCIVCQLLSNSCVFMHKRALTNGQTEDKLKS